MVEHMPTGNAAARHLGDPSWMEQLLWDIAYHQRGALVQQENMWRSKGTQPRKQDPFPRPYDDQVASDELTPEEIQQQRDQFQATLARPLPPAEPQTALGTTE